MKRKLLFKTIIVAAMLCMGTSAWATEPVTTGFVTVYSNDFESGSKPWGWSESGATIGLIQEDGGNHYMYLTNGGKSGTYNRSLLFSATYTKYELTFKWFAKTAASTGSKVQVKFVTDHSTGDASHYQFRFNDEASALTPTLQVCDNTTKKQQLTNYTQSTAAPSGIADFYTVKVASDGSYVRYTLTTPDGVSSVYYEMEYTSNNALGGILLQSNTKDNDILYIDNIVLKVPHTYTVNAVDDSDNILSELATGGAGEGAQYSVTGLPKVVTKDGKYYVLNDGTVTNFATQTYTMGTEDETKSITYTEDASIVYFGEVETMENSEASSIGSYSGGKYGAIDTKKYATLATLGAGNYQLEGRIVSNANRNIVLRNDKTNSDDSRICYINTTGVQTRDFTLANSTSLYLSGYTTSGGPNRSADIDYIIIRRADVPVPITNVGWATLYTAYPLDFSTLSTSLTAYTATCTGSTVTLTPVNNVPANTGVVLKGTADTYYIPTTASSSTDKGHMLGSATEATAYNAYDGYDLYMLVKNNDKAQFKKVTSGSIAAGKAFLKINSGASSLAPVMDVVFADDNTTGINTVQGSGFRVNGYYDLQGRKVANPTKGLYIVNGKKVIIK